MKSTTRKKSGKTTNQRKKKQNDHEQNAAKLKQHANKQWMGQPGNQRINYGKFSLKRIIASLKIRLFKDGSYAEKIPFDHLFNKYGSNDLAVSIGGDNYCYSSYEVYEILNKNFNKN